MTKLLFAVVFSVLLLVTVGAQNAFAGSGIQCGSLNCDQNAFCANPTTSQCTCNEGFAGDGLSCSADNSCSDSNDNDGDGLTDCFDGDCSADLACAPSSAEDCFNGVDDDGDFAVDCDDADCSAIPICSMDNVVVGGEVIPIDSTSLILADSQSTNWMIPVVLSIAGIGLFVAARKV